MDIALHIVIFAVTCRLLYWVGFPRSWAVLGGVLAATVGHVGLTSTVNRTVESANAIPSILLALVVLIISAAGVIGFWVGRAAPPSGDASSRPF